jgi:hypothetical protein
MSKRKSRHTFRPWPIAPYIHAWIFFDRRRHKPGDVITDMRGRRYRVGPAGNLIRTTPEARRG